MHYIGFCCFQQKFDVVHRILVESLDFFIFLFLGKSKYSSNQRESNTVYQIIVEKPSNSGLKS